MKRIMVPPQLPPVIDEYIDAIQNDLRRRTVSQRTHDTLRRRFGNGVAGERPVVITGLVIFASDNISSPR